MTIFVQNLFFVCMNLKTFIALFIISFSCLAQQTDIVDFIKIEAEIEPIASEKKVIGNVAYTFKVLKNTDSIYLDAVSMLLLNRKDSNTISIASEEKKIWFISNFEANKSYTVSFSYEAQPKKALYFTNSQIWTQGQGKYTSNWLPSIDDMNDKIEFDLTIISPSGQNVVANGKLISSEMRDKKTIFKFNMESPMSSYLVAFAIDNFDKQEIYSENGTPIQLYFTNENAAKFESTYRYSKVIFDFIEKEIGVPYPWQNYKQVPIRDFLYAGMENTTATFFSEAFVVDSIGFIDRNYVNVNAHELAHQWFGNLITEESGTHHWLQEGFATYYALLAEKEVFGEDYYFWKIYQSAEQLKALSDEGNGEALLNPNASSLTFYEKGAWALRILKQEVGSEVFKIAIQNYLNKFQFKNVMTDDFLAEVENVYGKDLSEFKRNWLEQSAFKAEEALDYLKQSTFINTYFETVALRPVALKDKKSTLKTLLKFPNDYLGQEVVFQLEGEPLAETLSLYKSAFESNNIYVRQAIALSMPIIPKDLKNYYESLLEDNSYVTQEAAFYNLWNNFPEDAEKYLETMKNVYGFQDRNIRQLWLALAIVTVGYEVENKAIFFNELKKFTTSNYSFEVREIAFGYFNSIGLWEAESLMALIDASQHHSWRFKKSSREILKKLLHHEYYKEKLKLLKKDLDEKSSKLLKQLEKE